MKPSAVILLVLAAVTALVLVLVNQEDTNTPEDISSAPVQVGQDSNPDISALPSEGSASERTAAPTTDGTQGAAEETMDGETAPYENELIGSVRNEGGGPIPGASVTLSRRPLQAMAFVNDPIDLSGDVQTVTSSEGDFRFIRIESYENYTLIVDHPDYSRKEVGNVRVGVTG